MPSPPLGSMSPWYAMIVLKHRGTHLDDDVLAGVFFVESEAERGHEILHISIKYNCINNNIKPFLGLYRQCRCCMRVNQLIILKVTFVAL